jgi:hypothetical protein
MAEVIEELGRAVEDRRWVDRVFREAPLAADVAPNEGLIVVEQLRTIDVRQDRLSSDGMWNMR